MSSSRLQLPTPYPWTSNSARGNPDCLMMLDSVPCLSVPWRGTGTVTVVFSTRFCMTRWLPRCRTATNPFCSRIRQTSTPDRTRSLPNHDLNLRHEDLAMETARNLCRVGGLKEKRQRFD